MFNWGRMPSSNGGPQIKTLVDVHSLPNVHLVKSNFLSPQEEEEEQQQLVPFYVLSAPPQVKHKKPPFLSKEESSQREARCKLNWDGEEKMKPGKKHKFAWM